MKTTISAAISPRRFLSSISRVEIMAPLGMGDPR
jgi:hypothetical protein